MNHTKTAFRIVRHLPPELQALRNQVLGFDPKPVVQRAIADGLAQTGRRLPALDKQELAAREATKRVRAARRAANLNTETGQPLKYQRHPELKGLRRKDYRRRWTAKKRKHLRGSKA